MMYIFTVGKSSIVLGICLVSVKFSVFLCHSFYCVLIFCLIEITCEFLIRSNSCNFDAVTSFCLYDIKFLSVPIDFVSGSVCAISSLYQGFRI